MTELLIITPVKDSLDTTLDTINSVVSATVPPHKYVVYNDFSSSETKAALETKQKELGFELVNLEDITDTPSPNYRLILQHARSMALELNVPLLITESDVTVKPDTFGKMLDFSRRHDNCGMVAAVTVDETGKVNFPYLNYKKHKEAVVEASHSLSFCSTLLSTDLLNTLSFSELSESKDWFDVFITRRSRQSGFKNYLLMDTPVLHRPHSSRPWKRLKYTNPLKYYIVKFFKRKDRI